MLSPLRRNRRLATLLGGILLLLLVAACSNDPQSTFDPRGPVAGEQRDLFALIFWLAVAVFIVVEGILVFSIWRFRHRPSQEGLPAQVHGNTRLEIVWTLIPVVILTIIAIPTYLTIVDEDEPPEVPPEDRVEVEVTGHQWWWEYEYPELGIVTANELVIPVGKLVDIRLISNDVVHSFWVPKLAGKVDVFPNRVNRLFFIADEPGTFFGQCAELCGVGHANMRLRVKALPAEEFDRWVAGQQQPPPPATGLAAEGQRLFATKGCVLCHTITGPDGPGVQEGRAAAFERGERIFPAPNLTFFGTRETFAGSILEVTPDNLFRWLKDPDAVKPGNRMAELAPVYHDPDLKLTNDETDALIEYLLSRKPAPVQ